MKNNNGLVSIIIPVYNAESYLERCLNSAISQTYSNIEVICVNDGSKDNSLKIIQEFEKKDKRVKLINKMNAGVSAARNDGIKNASGDYIIFVDADDWIDSKTIETSLEYANEYNAELVKYACVQEFNDSKRKVVSCVVFDETKYITRKDFASEVVDDFINSYNYNSGCLFLVKSSVISENNILFDETTFYVEDFVFNIDIYKNINGVVYLPYTFYHYMHNMNSITTKVSVDHIKKKIQDAIKNYSRLIDFCDTFECLDDKKRRQIEKRIKNEVLICIRTIYPAEELLNKEYRIDIMQFAIDECKKNNLELEINSKEKYDFKNLIQYRYLNVVKSVVKRIIYR